MNRQEAKRHMAMVGLDYENISELRNGYKYHKRLYEEGEGWAYPILVRINDCLAYIEAIKKIEKTRIVLSDKAVEYLEEQDRLNGDAFDF